MLRSVKSPKPLDLGFHIALTRMPELAKLVGSPIYNTAESLISVSENNIFLVDDELQAC